MANLSDSELKDQTLALFKEQTTMTLATSDGSRAWVAPVYYVNLDFQVYFFSNPGSKHIVESQLSHQASAAIYAQSSTWKGIRGVQMSGMIHLLPPGLEAAGAITAYIKKFPFVHEFFTDGQPVKLETFSKRFNARFYCFTAEHIYYLDNHVDFGFRAEVPL